MTLRTTAAAQQRQNLQDLQATQARMALNQARITSGTRITSPAEDPTAAALILDFGTTIDANTQSIRQVDSATAALQTAENAVSAAIEGTTRLQEIAASGSSSSVSEVNTILQNLLSLANTKFQGRFLFAGTQTDTQPFGATAPYAYSGNQSDINLAVTAQAQMATNLPGDEVFLGGRGLAPGASAADVFTAATTLAQGLTANDATVVASASTKLSAALDNLNQAEATLGGRLAGLQTLRDTLTTFNTSLQGLQSSQQDTDYAQSLTEYTSDQTIQSATLSVMAKAAKSNLFDYLA